MIYDRTLHSIPLKFKCFFNLTTAPLSRFLGLFNLGLKHIPIPKDVSDIELKDCMDDFHHKTLWSYYFERTRLDDRDEESFTRKLKPPKDKVRACNFINSNQLIHRQLLDLKSSLNCYINSNPVSPKRSKAISAIAILKDKFQEIVFRPADKNLGLCAMHISHYDQLVMEHLSNTCNYELKSSDSLSNSRLLQGLERSYLSFKNDMLWYDHEKPLIDHRFSFTFPKFHILPKLHKQGTIKGRPIAGQVNWITTPISRILDHRLQEHLHQFEDILPNSQQLVNDLELLNQTNHLSNGDLWLITGDIESLYPNIDIDRLIRIVDSIDFTCTQLTDFVCKNSYVSYNNRVYRQKNGIPMGTNAAVSLANIYVGSLIDRFISSRPEVFYYKRYIDDLFIIWKGDPTRWPNAASAIQRILGIPINFETPSKSQAVFLDLQVSRCIHTKSFKTCVYQKPLNKYNYITPVSCHAPHMLKGFINGELTRYARLSTSAFAYLRTKQLFFERLLQRGYTRMMIRPIFRRHRWTSRFREKNTSTRRILPFIIPYTYRSNAHDITKIVKSYAQDIESHFSYSKVLVAYRRRRNIMDLLCPSSISRTQSRLLQRQEFKYSSTISPPLSSLV
jgi:hypothetical protein